MTRELSWWEYPTLLVGFLLFMALVVLAFVITAPYRWWVGDWSDL